VAIPDEIEEDLTMKRLIQHLHWRRGLALALVVMGGLSFFLAPGNAPAGFLLAGAGVLLEVIGITLKHEES
jgi:energy-converting hydrogenase Eha subunit G